MAFAAHSAHEGAISLKNNRETRVMRLQVAGNSKLVIFGRVVIENNDSDTQKASALLVAIPSSAKSTVILDLVEVFLDERSDGNFQSISLQGVWETSQQDRDPSRAAPDESIDLRCSTHDGFARQAKLYAISVDELRDGTPE
jgi:hypothetical protein